MDDLLTVAKKAKTQEAIDEEARFIVQSCLTQLWIACMLLNKPDNDETAKFVEDFVGDKIRRNGPKETMLQVAKEVIKLLSE